MLTARQSDLLEFIRECLDRNGYAPSYSEMAQALGLQSKSGVCRLVGGLEERGYIGRIRHRERAIEVLRDPEGATDLDRVRRHLDILVGCHEAGVDPGPEAWVEARRVLDRTAGRSSRPCPDDRVGYVTARG